MRRACFFSPPPTHPPATEYLAPVEALTFDPERALDDGLQHGVGGGDHAAPASHSGGLHGVHPPEKQAVEIKGGFRKQNAPWMRFMFILGALHSVRCEHSWIGADQVSGQTDSSWIIPWKQEEIIGEISVGSCWPTACSFSPLTPRAAAASIVFSVRWHCLGWEWFTGVQSRFSALPLTCSDFSRFSELIEDIMDWMMKSQNSSQLYVEEHCP